MEEKDYYNVPIYIEKAIKKLIKTENIKKELVAQIREYMQTHNIPTDTPLTLLKYFPKEEISENQMQLDF